MVINIIKLKKKRLPQAITILRSFIFVILNSGEGVHFWLILWPHLMYWFVGEYVMINKAIQYLNALIILMSKYIQCSDWKI